MEEGTNFSAEDTNYSPVEDLKECAENILSSPKMPANSVKDSRDEFLDSLIEAELNDSNPENTEHSTEMLVEDNTEFSTDDAHKISAENMNEIHELNESEMSVTDTDATNVDITDGTETEQLPALIPDDDKFVKPKDVLCHFPLGRIKRIVKADPEVPVISAESLFLISKATVCRNIIVCNFL